MKTVRAFLVLFLLGSFLPGSAQELVEVRPVHVYAVSHTNDQAVVLTAVIEATSTDDNAVILKRIGDNAFTTKEATNVEVVRFASKEEADKALAEHKAKLESSGVEVRELAPAR